MENYIEFHEVERSPVMYIEFEYEVDECCTMYPTKKEASSNDIDNYEDLRSEEYTIYTLASPDDENDIIVFSVKDGRTDRYLDAILSMVRTLFVSIVLSAGAMSFSRDVE